MMIFIESIFLMLFLIILIDVHKNKNIDLAINAIAVLIFIMFLKILLWLNSLYHKKSTCNTVKQWFC